METATLTGKTLLNRYYLQQLIGSGGMADIYLAWDKLRSSKMAVKILRRDLSRNAVFFEQFQREAEILSQLEHPNIVRLYEFRQDGDLAFIVLDWVDGSDLRKVIKESKSILPYRFVGHVLDSVCPALQYAHTYQIYHCDIKPANIMLHADGRVLLTDFGVAYLANQSGGGGTPPYMAPEQFNDGKIDARTDVYALGITLYEILSGGKPPYRGESANSKGTTPRERIEWEHLNISPPPIQQFNPSIPSAIEKIITTAIDKRAERRFPSAMAIRDAYNAASGPYAASEARSDKETVEEFTRLLATSTSLLLTATNKFVDRLAKQVSTEFPLNPSEGKHQEYPSQPPSSLKKPSAMKTTQREPNLYCRIGQWAGQFITIPMGEITFGRGSQCQVRLADGSVSRLHATLIRSVRGVYIRDEGSSLGTFVNGKRVTAPLMLEEKDVIQIGYQQVFEYRKG